MPTLVDELTVKLDATDRGLLLLGLRTIRNDLTRKTNGLRTKLANWTDADEAGKLGFRQAMTDMLSRQGAQLERIEPLYRRLRRKGDPL